MSIGRGFMHGLAAKHYLDSVMETRAKSNQQETPLNILEALEKHKEKQRTTVVGIFKSMEGTIASTEKTNPEGYTHLNTTERTLEWVRSGFCSQYESVMALNFSSLSHEAWLSRMNSTLPIEGTDFIQENVIFETHENKVQFAQYLKDRGYRHGQGSNLYNFDNKNNITSFINLKGINVNIVSIFKDEVDEIVKELSKYTYIRGEQGRLTTITGISQSGLQTRNEELDPSKIKTATSEFYPWMNGTSIQEYFYEFMNSDANVLVFYGLPGTGKSTLIQTGISTLGLSAVLCADAAVSSNPEFVSKLGAWKEENEGKAKWDVVIVEDGDVLMAPRTKGNVGLSSLLSATDGLGNEGKFKLVITTNATDTSQIDPALLRPGRCFDIMEFGRLSPEEAGLVRKSLGLPEYKFTAPAILASALNVDVKTMRRTDDSSTVEPRFPLKKKKD